MRLIKLILFKFDDHKFSPGQAKLPQLVSKNNDQERRVFREVQQLRQHRIFARWQNALLQFWSTPETRCSPVLIQEI
jgi:hypothetical protein